MTPGGLRRGEAAALAALALLVLCLNITPITNNDLFLHLTTGEGVLHTGSVPRVDDYSALARGRPFIAHEWLAGVVFRLVQKASGWSGLIVLKAVTAVAVASLLLATARRLGTPPEIAIPALAFVLVLAAARFVERPHIFTFVLAAAYLLLLARRRAGARSPLWAFFPLQILWANLHGGFILGPAIVALASAGSALDRLLFRRPDDPPGLPSRGRDEPAGSEATSPMASTRETLSLALLAAGLLAASLVNPYGLRLLRLPFELTSSSFMGEIYEWLPPLLAFDLPSRSFVISPFASTYVARYYVVWLVFGLLSYGLAVAQWRRRRLPLPGGSFSILLFLMFLVLSLRMNRNVTDFALVTLPGVAATFAAVRQRLSGTSGTASPSRTAPSGRLAALHVVAAGLAGLAVWFAVFGYPFSPSMRRSTGLGLGRNIPVAATDYLQGIGMHGSVFNTYASGAYLIYRLYPEVRVAMDSRNDVYGEELYREYSKALTDAETLESLMSRIGCGAILLEWPNQGMMTAAATVHLLKPWTPVYFDDVAVVYLREDGPWSATVKRDGYALLNPALYRGGAIRRENGARALQEADRAMAKHQSYIARVMRIDALFVLDREKEAAAEEARILAEDPPLFHIYTHLGWIRLARGERTDAAERFLRALKYRPDSQLALQGLSLARGTAAH